MEWLRDFDENTRHLSYSVNNYGYPGNKIFKGIYETIVVDEPLHVIPEEKIETLQTGPASWLNCLYLSIVPDTWYIRRYAHPRCNRLVPHRVGITCVVWCVLEQNSRVSATPLAKTQGMKPRSSVLAVDMDQSDDCVRFWPKHLAQNVTGSSVK